MEKLMKPAEYAKELGISRQAVYAKIKRGILTAKNVDGKLYIIVDSDNNSENNKVKETTTKNREVKSNRVKKETNDVAKKEYEKLLASKDETISVLKGTVKDLKKSNKQISSTLKGEIDLLKEAFHEMRNLYMLQLEHKKDEKEELIEVYSEDESREEAQIFKDADSKSDEIVKEKWVSVKKFFKKMDIVKVKKQEKVLKRLQKAHKRGENCLKKVDGKLKINLLKDYDEILA